MNTIIIVSALFFNKKGNQSLLETVKYYSKFYNVIFITCASVDDSYYYQEDEINKILQNKIKIIRVYQIIPNLLRKLKKLKKNVKLPDTNATNLSYSILNKISFFLSGIFLYFALKRNVTNSVNLICAYEIGAIYPVFYYKKNNKNVSIKYMAKFQGTVIGFDISKLGHKKHKKLYSLDYKAFSKAKYFDLCAITNDGTNGKTVLKFFEVPESKIISLPNGISENVKNIAKTFKVRELTTDKNSKIHLFCLSRLVLWKRVWLSIEIMNYLVNNLKCYRYDLNIYGYGNNAEVNELYELINKYKLQDYVKINGPVEYSRIVDVFKNNDIMLSLYRFTNVTNPVLESIYLGIPVISIFDNDLEEIVKQTKTKKIKLIREESVNQLIEDISLFLKNEDFVNIKNNTLNTDILDWNTRLAIELKLLFQ